MCKRRLTNPLPVRRLEHEGELLAGLVFDRAVIRQTARPQANVERVELSARLRELERVAVLETHRVTCFDGSEDFRRYGDGMSRLRRMRQHARCDQRELRVDGQRRVAD